MEIKTNGMSIKIIEKLIEFIKEKSSKKQVIAIVGLICLFALNAPPLCIAVVTVYAITAQTVLDYKNPIKEKNYEKKSNLISVGNGDAVAGRTD